MVPQVIALSGPVGAGKSTLAHLLSEKYKLIHFKSSDYLIEQANERGIPLERGALQKLGEELDRKTKGQWIVDAIRRKLSDPLQNRSLVIDAVRIQKQLDVIRRAFGLNVVHVHLTAPVDELAR